jgi:bifunctional NMN adenylyltransferase/nudix hydrolase
VIIFLGIPVIQNTRKNPLDFATRKAMVQKNYPDVIILPLKDQRNNEIWSDDLDSQIKIPFGERSALLYGGRDSFIPYYSGKYRTTELVTDTYVSGTEIRNKISKQLLNSSDFRAGIIHANYAQRPVTYSTVDIVAYNDNNQILLAKKPNENKYRFIGGFVDRTDSGFEHSARREFMEETGGANIEGLTYVTSRPIDDWRYTKEESGIMTTLFVGKYTHGQIKPSDDISELTWVNIGDIDLNHIMLEHVELMATFLDKVAGGKIELI